MNTATQQPTISVEEAQAIARAEAILDCGMDLDARETKELIRELRRFSHNPLVGQAIQLLEE